MGVQVVAGGTVTQNYPIPEPNQAPQTSSGTQLHPAPSPTPNASGPAPHSPAPGQTSFSHDPAQAAQQVLNTGKGWSFLGIIHGGENDAARVKALADALDQGDTAYRQQLMADISKDDPNSLGTWFTPANAEQLTASGQISKVQEGQLATAFADSYLSGHLPTTQAFVGNPDAPSSTATVNMTALDKSLLGGYLPGASAGADPDRTILTNAQNIHQFLDFVNSSNSGDMTAFRQAFSQHLISQYVLNPTVASDPALQEAAAGLSANLLTGDPNQPHLAVTTLATLSRDPQTNQADVQTFMQAAAGSNSVFGSAIAPRAASFGLNAQDVSVPNGAAQIFKEVAGVPPASASQPGTALPLSKDADALAVDFAALPAISPSMFGSKDNANALTQAIAVHASAVFNYYSPNTSLNITPSVDDPNSVAVFGSQQVLGRLFQSTLYNPLVSSQNKNLLNQHTTSYLNQLVNEINQNPNGHVNDVTATPENRLAVMLASLAGGVRQGFVDQADAQAARDQLIGTLLDTAASAIPAGDFTGEKVASFLEGVFSGDSHLQTALKNIAKQGTSSLVDLGKDQLTASAKGQLTAALNQDLSRDGPNSSAAYFNDLVNSVLSRLNSSNTQGTLVQTTAFGLYTAYNQDNGVTSAGG